MRKFSPIFLLFICFLFFVVLDGEGKTFKGNAQTLKKDEKNMQKLYQYDHLGNLVINGSVPGTSLPIVIDSKIYFPTCTTNVYYIFVFKIPATFNNSKEDICREGITICYDGNLVGDHMRAEFNVPNLVFFTQHEEMTKSCVLANGNKSHESVRALNVAVRTFEDSAIEKLESLDKNLTPNNTFGGDPKTWHFFFITSNFVKKRSVFVVPEDGIMLLKIGGPESFGISVIDSMGREIPEIILHYKDGQSEGVLGSMQIPSSTIMDMTNGGNIRNHRGLWMLYLDFKTDYRTWQVISTVHPNWNQSRCSLLLEMRGNRMRPCLTYFENIAIFEPVNAEVNVTYTSEIGTIKMQNYGQEDMTATANRWKKAQLQAQTIRDNSKNSESDSIIDETELQSIHDKIKETAKLNIKKGEAEVGVSIPLVSAIFDLGVKGGGNLGFEDYEATMNRNTRIKSKITRNTERMFSEMSRSSAMMQSFKSTSGAAEEMTNAELEQTSTAFSNVESVGITITLPPKKKLVIKQLMFDCDGSVVKMPFIYYSDGVNKLDLKNYNNGPRRHHKNFCWSGGKPKGKNITGNPVEAEQDHPKVEVEEKKDKVDEYMEEND